MGNDIEIRVRVANNTAAGLTAVNNSLRRLRDEAQDAGRGLDGLTARATAATVALRALKDAAQDASRALRSLNTAARNADGRLDTMSTRSRTLRRDTDDLDGSMRRLTTTMGGLRTSSGSINLTASSNGMNGLRKAALLLSPALIPIAAATVPIIASAGAATVALGVFTAAVIGQVSAAQGAADAQGKYTAAVEKYGPASEQAAQAQNEWLTSVKKLDPETRKAGAAMQVFNDATRQWSKDLAGSTMPVFTKGMATLGGLLPQMAPLVRSTSTELDRLMTVLAGGVASDGFSAFMTSFSEFASGALSKATDGLVRFMRTMSGGGGSSQFTEFMAYVKEVGPQVGETLGNLGRALAHVVAAASESGVSILSVVNAFSRLVNAIPTEALSNLLQFVLVLKAVKIAAAGFGTVGGALGGFGTSIAAMAAASTAAGGGLAGLAAAFGTLSRAAKVALIGSGIGILVVVLSELSEMSRKAPPDVDKLTTSLRAFAAGGVVSGEAARSFGKDLSGLGDALQKVKDPKGLDQVQQSIMSFFGTDSTPVKDAKENIDALDQSLANLVKNGQADLAASALDNITAQMKKQGFSSEDVTSQLDNYKAALADQAFEAQLAAEAQGLFGEQAAAVQTKLDAQKASADGLRGAIQALNEVQRQGLGGMIGFEAAIDAAAKAATDNAGALSMTDGHLDLNSENARNAATALQDLASRTDEAAASARESGSSWETVSGIYERGRSSFIDAAQTMGLTKEQAKQLAEQIMNIPDSKSTKYEMNVEDAKAGLEAFNAAVKKTPGAKSVTLKTLSQGAESILEAFGLKVKRLPDGSVKVTAKNGQAISGIADVAGAISHLDGRTATTYVVTKYRIQGNPNIPSGTYLGSTAGRSANGNIYAGRSYADGGMEQHVAQIAQPTFRMWAEPETGGEAYIPLSPAKRPRSRAIAEETVGILGGQVEWFAKGGMSDAMKSARSGLRGQMSISALGRAAGYKRTEMEKALGAPSDLGSLVSALNQLRGDIKAAFSGKAESRLLKTLNSVGGSLIKYEKQLTAVNKSLEKAKDKLNDLKSSAASLASSVKGGILSAANITSGNAGKNVTVGSIVQGLTDNRDKATAFSKALTGLKSKGVASSLIQQIAEAGIEGGGLETAGALLSAGSNDIEAINSLQSQISSAATAAGKTTADSVYGQAIKAQTAATARLQKSQDKLEKTMAGLAKTMERAISRALGGKASGGIVGAAASGGIRSNLTWVGEQGPELLDLPAGARVWSNADSRRKAAAPWASMLNSPRRAGAAASGAAVAVQPIVVHQTITLDGKVVARAVFEPLKEEIRGRGGNVQNSLGQPGR